VVSVSDGQLTTQTEFFVTVNDSVINDPAIAPWSTTEVYQATDKVSFQERVYLAKWWNQGQHPDSSSAWELVEEGTNPAAWSINKAYQAGAEIIYQGQRYRANWWTQGDTPGQADVWKTL
jgi:chitin-binding protein